MSPRIVFLIRDLAYGGAQRQLLTLAQGLVREGCEVTVIHFYHGALEEGLSAAGVRTLCMEKGGRWDLGRFLWKLWRCLRDLRPAVLHSYMAEPNLLSALLKPLLPGVRVVWGIRDSRPDAALYGLAARVSFQIGRILSRVPDVIIANSRAGRDYYVSIGFPASAIQVIPNGIDVGRFVPARALGTQLRETWLPDGEGVLFGLVGRMNPMKDHAAFLSAAVRVAEVCPSARFVCLGDGPEPYRLQMERLAASLGLGSKVQWSAARKDMPKVYNALDALVSSSSFAEGFSNVIGEAMACAVPCIGTDVGDTSYLIGDAGFVVAPQDHEALAAAMLGFLRLTADERQDMGTRARARIERDFTVEQLVRRTSELCVGHHRPVTNAMAQLV